MFQGLKKYLASLPLLSKTVTKETLYLYLAVSESTVSRALVRRGVQKPVYYISKSLLDAETRYPMMKKMILALSFISRKLKHYF